MLWTGRTMEVRNSMKRRAFRKAAAEVKKAKRRWLEKEL
jgi:hypothetical protein